MIEAVPCIFQSLSHRRAHLDEIATLGFLYDVLRDESLRELRKHLQLGSDSRILLFNTEGDTDPENYRRIVWAGWHTDAGTS